MEQRVLVVLETWQRKQKQRSINSGPRSYDGKGARESLGRLLLPLSFWCTVYALWAVPLWCTRGWCCCCCYCCCHFCRPDASLDEICMGGEI
ncbi:Uncharacterized protein GBIM_08264 [Gryllus bimaculatus]|nr:Uncharacterized protein GBIM_08264 [Gryllus bimaculatus]